MSPVNVAEYSNDDCYFFMYAECTKGTSCLYRHSAAAKASATICRYWWNGTCMRRDCKFRHIENKVTLRKNEYKKEAEGRMYPLYDRTKVDEYMEEHNRRVNATEEDIGDDREKERRLIAKMIERLYERYKPYEFRPQFVKKSTKTEKEKCATYIVLVFLCTCIVLVWYFLIKIRKYFFVFIICSVIIC